MDSKVHSREEAIELRVQGLSYNEIKERLNVAKSTLSLWLRDVQLSDEARRRILDRIGKGLERSRFLAAQRNVGARQQRERIVRIMATAYFERFKSDPFFAYGLALYAAEGSKRNTYLSLINSDPKLVKLFIHWLEHYLKIGRSMIKLRLYIPDHYRGLNRVGFWKDYLGFFDGSFEKTIYKANSFPHLRNPDYPGCLRVSVYRIDLLRTVLTWIDLFHENEI